MIILVFFWLFNFFDVHFACYFSYFSLFWDALERSFHNKTRTFFAFFAGITSSMLIFLGNSRTFRCSAASGPRTDVDFSWHFSCFSVFCNIRPKNFSV